MTITNVIMDLGLSYEDILERSGLPESTLSDILSGKTNLSHCQARTLQKFSKGLGMSMEDVLSLDSAMNEATCKKRNPARQIQRVNFQDIMSLLLS